MYLLTSKGWLLRQVIGLRPDVFWLVAFFNKCRTYFDTILAHIGQN